MRRHLPHVTAHEFRAADQVALLREIATWFKTTEKQARLPLFLLGVQLDLREEDIDSPKPYKATVFLDGPESLG